MTTPTDVEAMARLRKHAQWLDDEHPTGIDANGPNQHADDIRLLLSECERLSRDLREEHEELTRAAEEARPMSDPSDVEQAMARLRGGPGPEAESEAHEDDIRLLLSDHDRLSREYERGRAEEYERTVQERARWDQLLRQAEAKVEELTRALTIARAAGLLDAREKERA